MKKLLEKIKASRTDGDGKMNEGQAWAISRLVEHGNTRQPSTAELHVLRRRLAQEFETAETEGRVVPVGEEKPSWWMIFAETFNFKAAGLVASAAVALVAILSIGVVKQEMVAYKGTSGIEIELYSGDRGDVTDPKKLSYVAPEATVLSDQYLQFRLVSKSEEDRYLYIGAFDEKGIFTWYFPSPSFPEPLLIPAGDVVYSPVSVDVGRTHTDGLIRIAVVESATPDISGDLDEIFRTYAGKISYDVGIVPPEDLTVSVTDYELYSFLLVVKSLN
jgi:hypothetical protein